jgi:thioredoxin 1
VSLEGRIVEKRIPIVRMECPTCIPVLEKEVWKLDGVEEVRGNFMSKTLKVIYDPERVELYEIEAAVERLGYRIAYKKYPSVIDRLKGFFQKEEQESVESLLDADFSGKVLHSSRLVAVLFSSTSCPTCRIFMRQYLELAKKIEGGADLYEMDIAETETWRKYDILTIPTVIVFNAGEIKDRLTGLPKTEEIEEALQLTTSSGNR